MNFVEYLMSYERMLDSNHNEVTYFIYYFIQNIKLKGCL